MGKKPLVLRHKRWRVIAKKEFMRLYGEEKRFIIGYRHVSALFVDRSVILGIDDMIRIVKHIPVLLVDAEGYIVAEVRQSR